MRRHRLRIAPGTLTILLILVAAALVSIIPIRQSITRAHINEARQGLPNPLEIPHTLTFKVNGEGLDAPLPEVRYRVRTTWRDPWEEIDAAGVYAHTAPKDVYYLHYSLSAPGFETQYWVLPLFNETEARLALEHRLRPAQTVSGRVLDLEGAPIAGVRVQASMASEDPWHVYRRGYAGEAETGEDGWWSLTDLPPDGETINLWYTHSSYATHPHYRWDVPIHTEGGIIQRMSSGVPIKVQVVDQHDKPVPGASVALSGPEHRSAESDDQGVALLRNCVEKTDKTRNLVVRADGYARGIYELSAEDVRKPFVVVLDAARPLKLAFQIAGMPLPSGTEVTASIQKTPHNRDRFDAYTTNDAGVIVVPDPPGERDWLFSFRHPREHWYAATEAVQLAPGANHTFELQAPTRILLAAKDAGTGELLEHFHVTPGFIRLDTDRPWWRRVIDSGAQTTEVDWEYDARLPWHRLYRGYFDSSWTRLTPDHRMILRVDAVGYHTSETRLIRLHEGELLLVVEMTPGETTRLRVALPNGLQAHDARAAWVPTDTRVIAWDPSYHARLDVPVIEADDARSLAMPPVDRSDHTLMVQAEEGAAFIPGGSVENGQEIVLTPWGEVQLKVAPHIREAYGDKYRIRGNERLADLNVSFNIGTSLEGSEPGNATLFPVEYWIGPDVMREDLHFLGMVPWQEITVRPGETTPVELARGRAVTGRMEMPTEVWTWLRETPLWLTAKYESKTAEIPWPINEVVLEINEEGTIVGGPLPPGDYSIEENYLLDPDQPRGGQRIRFWVEDASFTIPEDGDPAKPIDLGVIHVKEGLEEDAQPLQAGDLAPDFTITTLEGASIKLSSLRGGYVLLDFWATWCGPCVGETPHLKAVWDRFGERYDFTIIGLSLDDERDLLEAYIRENHIAWPQAFLNGWRGSPLTTEYKVRGIPEIMLIGPDGRVVENNLRGGKIMRVVQEALGG